eukprot:698796-Prymnesium_polylepis.3
MRARRTTFARHTATASLHAPSQPDRLTLPLSPTGCCSIMNAMSALHLFLPPFTSSSPPFPPPSPQVALADRLLLNKMDLLADPAADAARIEGRLRALNAYAPITRCHDAQARTTSTRTA